MTPGSQVYSILVGIDYSTESELALAHALELAATQPESILHVVHVIQGPDEVAASDDAPLAQATATTMSNTPLLDSAAHCQLDTYVAVSLGAFEKKHGGRARGVRQVIDHLRIHNPSQKIAQLASDLGVDVVVVGTHGRGTVPRFFVGSVAERVARLAPCPVLVFRPKGAPRESPNIAPPCPACVQARAESGGRQYCCQSHRPRHGKTRRSSKQPLRLSER